MFFCQKRNVPTIDMIVISYNSPLFIDLGVERLHAAWRMGRNHHTHARHLRLQ